MTSAIITAADTLAGAEAFMRAGAKAEAFSRDLADVAAITIASGTPRVAACRVGRIRSGQTVTTIAFESGSTPLTVGTSPHQFAILMDETRKILAYSADLTSQAWAATSEQVFTIVGGYLATQTFYPMLALCIAQTGGTLPTLTGYAGGTGPNGLAPIVGGSTGAPMTGLTDPASAIAVAPVGSTMPALSASANNHYCWVG